MTETEVQIDNRLGLHARAAARFVHLANRFQACITVSNAGAQVDGKSLLGLLTLAASKGSQLCLAAHGVDEEEALSHLVRLVQERFGEAE